MLSSEMTKQWELQHWPSKREQKESGHTVDFFYLSKLRELSAVCSPSVLVTLLGSSWVIHSSHDRAISSRDKGSWNGLGWKGP